jgi:iron complex transport system permease protein
MLREMRNYRLLWAGGLILLLGFAAAALCLGQYRIAPAAVLRALAGAPGVPPNDRTVIFKVRLPRILLAMLAGCGMAVSGAAFQSLFSNPLATPDTLGTANGASFGAALGLLLGLPALGVQLFALVFGIAAVALVFLVTAEGGSGRRSMMMVILAGMVISALFSALVSLIKYAADPQDTLPAITFWLMGSLSGTTFRSLLFGAPLIMAGTLLLWLLRFRMNTLSLSEDEARSLGLNLPLVRGLVIGASAAVTAAVVSLCGVIGWVGLLVPHLVRMAVGNDNRRIIPASMVAGALFLLVVDTAARCAAKAEIPVSILTSVIGAPLFILLLRKTGGIRA